MLLLDACLEPRTEIVLTVGSDLAVPADLDGVAIEASGRQADGGFRKTYDITQPKLALPLELGILPQGGAADPCRGP